MCVLALCGLVSLTCAPVAPKRTATVRVTPATQQPSAKPAVSEARRLSDAANIQSALAAEQVSRASKGVRETQREMQRLVETTTRLRQQKTVSENELLQLYLRIVEQEKRTRLLVTAISDAESTLAAERGLRAQVGAKLIEAEALVVSKEAEAAQLRAQLVHVSDVLDDQKRLADANADLASKAAARASELEGASDLKTKLLIGTVCLLVVAGLVIILLIRTRLPI